MTYDSLREAHFLEREIDGENYTPEVLIVDDTPENLLALEAVLKPLCCRSICANSGHEALAYLEKHDVALVLLDIQMPGLDGFQTAEEIRRVSDLHRVPVIFVTAIDANPEHLKRAYAAGAVDVLFKPLNSDILRAKVLTFIELFNYRRNLTQALHAEARSREQAVQEKYRDLVDCIDHAVIWSCEPDDMTFTFVSPRAVDITGFDLKEWFEEADFFFNHIPKEDQAIVRKAFSGAETGKDFGFEHRFITSSGNVIWFHTGVRLAKKGQGKKHELRGLSVDVTKIKEAEQAAKASKALSEKASERMGILSQASALLSSSLDYQTTLKNLSQLAVPRLADWCKVDILERDGGLQQISVAHVNPKKEEFGWNIYKKYPSARDDSRGAYWVIKTSRSTMNSVVTDEMIEGWAQNSEHLQMLRELGFISYMCVPLIARGKVLGAISFIATRESGRHFNADDLSLAEELGYRAGLAYENSKLFSESQTINQVKDEFLATLSHELRTPLSVILGNSELLANPEIILSPEEQKQSLDAIHRNANLQTQIIQDLLDVSSIITGKMSYKPAKLSPARVIDEICKALQTTAEAKGIRLTCELNGAPESIFADETRLHQIIWNLVSNAIKFTPMGGEVIIGFEHTESSCRIEVIDSGKGIEPEFLPYVFDRFRQEDSSSSRRYGGLGLGLSIVRSLVELHGGYVKAESEGPGRGAKFIVNLPLRSPIPVPESDAQIKSNPSEQMASVAVQLSGVRILLIEDSADNRVLVTRMLVRSGAEVTQAESAAQARHLLKESKPDIIVSDIGMPDENGLEFIQKLRASSAEFASLPAIALTAYVRSEEKQKAFEAGFQAHVSKPVTPSALLNEISKVLHRSGQR